MTFDSFYPMSARQFTANPRITEDLFGFYITAHYLQHSVNVKDVVKPDDGNDTTGNSESHINNNKANHNDNVGDNDNGHVY